jgi:hypothetical protein
VDGVARPNRAGDAVVVLYADADAGVTLALSYKDIILPDINYFL